MRATIALVVVVGAGCAEPAIGLSFVAPQQVPAGFDMSCVKAVDVIAIGNDRGNVAQPPDFEMTCVDLPRGPKSFDDVKSMLSGQIDVPLPESGLAAMMVAGYMGSCDSENPYHETMFYGGGPAGGDTVAVTLDTNVSCASQTQFTVRSIDLLALAATGTCTPTPGQIFAGTIRPYLLGDDFPLMMFEFGADGAESAAGLATIKSFGSGGPRSCVAVGAQSLTNNIGYAGGTCVNAQARTVCGTAGELEVATLPESFSIKSRDPQLLEQYGEPVIGAIFDNPVDPAAPRTPVAGATITVGGEGANSRVVYAKPDATTTQLVEAGTASTDPSGFFMIYLKGTPTQITVSAPGHKMQTFTVASSLDWSSTLAVGLEPL